MLLFQLSRTCPATHTPEPATPQATRLAQMRQPALMAATGDGTDSDGGGEAGVRGAGPGPARWRRPASRPAARASASLTPFRFPARRPSLGMRSRVEPGPIRGWEAMPESRVARQTRRRPGSRDGGSRPDTRRRPGACHQSASQSGAPCRAAPPRRRCATTCCPSFPRNTGPTCVPMAEAGRRP